MTDAVNIPWFHLKDGWWFTRTGDGSVNIVKHQTDDPHSEIIAAVLIPANEWASVVASVSRDGENHYGWYGARDFHNEIEHRYEAFTPDAHERTDKK